MRGGYCCGHSSLLCFPPPGPATPPVCLTSHLVLIFNHAHLVVIANQLPFINPWIPCCRCQIILRSTVVMMPWHDDMPGSSKPYYLALASCCFDHNLTPFPSARSYPDHSLQLACLPLLPASSSSTSSSTSFNKPSYIKSTPFLSALGFSIVYHNTHIVIE